MLPHGQRVAASMSGVHILNGALRATLCHLTNSCCVAVLIKCDYLLPLLFIRLLTDILLYSVPFVPPILHVCIGVCFLFFPTPTAALWLGKVFLLHSDFRCAGVL